MVFDTHELTDSIIGILRMWLSKDLSIPVQKDRRLVGVHNVVLYESSIRVGAREDVTLAPAGYRFRTTSQHNAATSNPNGNRNIIESSIIDHE